MDLEGPWVALEGRRLSKTQILYAGTQGEALKVARRWWAEHFGPKGDMWDVDNWLKVTRVEVDTSKHNVVAMLNSAHKYKERGVVRLWDFNNRRGAGDQAEPNTPNFAGYDGDSDTDA
jgi:hypothetical protein